MGRQHTTGPPSGYPGRPVARAAPFAYPAPRERRRRDRARPPLPHRERRVPRPSGAPPALRGGGPPGRGELLRLLEARDRGEPRPLRPRGERARPRAAPRPPLQQDGRRLARLRRGHRPRHRVRLPGRLRGPTRPRTCCASTPARSSSTPTRSRWWGSSGGARWRSRRAGSSGCAPASWTRSSTGATSTPSPSPSPTPSSTRCTCAASPATRAPASRTPAPSAGSWRRSPT